MLKPFALVFALVSFSGCAATLGWEWEPDSVLKAPPASEYEGQPAVFLLRRERMLSSVQTNLPSKVEWQKHEIIAILNEKGFSYADVRVSYPAEDADIVAFEARTVGPDGSVVEVEPSRIFDDEAKEGDRSGWKVRVFTFPNVKPGSVLEYQYMIRSDGRISNEFAWVDHRLPTKRYEVEVQGTNTISYNVRAYNIPSDAAWTTTTDGDLWKLSWGMNDIPALEDEAHMVPRDQRSPWWMYTVNGYTWLRGSTKVHVDWTETTKHRAKALYEPDADVFSGFEPKVDYSGCTNAECKLDRALAYLRTGVPFRKFTTRNGRKAREVVDSGYADSFEKARLLHELLKRASVPAQFALTNRRGRVLVDDDQPFWNRLKHVVLLVDLQEETKRWIDPSCEFCTTKTIPTWLKGERALVLAGQADGLASDQKYTGEWKPITGTFAPTRSYVRGIDLSVDAGGDAKVTIEEIDTAFAAQLGRSEKRYYKDEDWVKNAESRAKDFAATAIVVNDSRLQTSDDVSVAKRTIELKVPSYATLDGGRLLIPLSIVHSAWDGRFEKKKRKTDLFIADDYTTTDRVRLAIPDGYRVKGLLEPTRASSPFLDAEVAVETTDGFVTVTRTLHLHAGVHDAGVYGRVQEALAAFKAVDEAVLILAPTTEAPRVADR